MFALTAAADPRFQRKRLRRHASNAWRRGLLFAAIATIIPPTCAFAVLTALEASAVACPAVQA
jgi:hypothetical protein